MYQTLLIAVVKVVMLSRTAQRHESLRVSREVGSGGIYLIPADLGIWGALGPTGKSWHKRITQETTG